ncbi:hypothetical protein Agabi119p4_3893 [Agaricus bisporus var. burnettii]|uniref:Uncharacterized protein n=1 Tax=Agaricus bisporus var. burnettii TaxID=192524 RepID=A0A8H7F5N9_AGABI|nr:hypothetical protein Agabi119p4_3893 [Agaricus bisporus var. burnettii]
MVPPRNKPFAAVRLVFFRSIINLIPFSFVFNEVMKEKFGDVKFQHIPSRAYVLHIAQLLQSAIRNYKSKISSTAYHDLMSKVERKAGSLVPTSTILAGFACTMGIKLPMVYS